MSEPVRALRRHGAELGLGALVVSVVALMIVPLPTWLLDLLLATNLSLAVLLVLTALFVRRALSFGAFPTILLVTTLFRLALNVSSTRLILLNADAGEVISAFGEFVVRGDYVVGAVVFAVITLIQFVVIARGSERVAEVGARFTLDAMPGRQLAIDADLRNGTIDATTAGALRRELSRESQFYGAMDGAMKFVKGDAIAALAITLVNLGGGLVIGVGFRELDAQDALQTYGLLTIGDGLVSQIPALLISTAAGLVVTRVASEHEDASLGRDIGAQVFGDWRSLGVASVFSLLLAIVPGLPALPFGVLAAIGLALAVFLARRAPPPDTRTPDAGPPRGSALEIAVGPRLARVIADDPAWLETLTADARTLYRDLGVRAPDVRPIEEPALGEDGFSIRLGGVEVDRGERGGEGDSARFLARRLLAAARARPDELMGIEETQRELDRLSRDAPALVRAIVPGRLELPRLAALLRGLLAERVSVRPLREILEAIGASADHDDDDALLTEVRRRLARPLTHTYARDGALSAHPLDPMIEEVLREPQRALAPDLADELLAALRRAYEAHPDAVVVTQPDVRLKLRRLTAPELPELPILSYAELDPEVRVTRLDTVSP
ncbi:MAG: flagellar biosynthesis protein FlhA [Sandaracinaceae bacterium]